MGIKVLHLIDSGGLYGAEKMLLSLVKEQVRQGLEPMILSAGEPGIEEKAIEAEARKTALPVTPWRMKPGLNLQESWKILKWAQGNHYDLLHSHGFKFNVLLGMCPGSVRRIPLVATLHGYVHASRFSKMWLYESLDRFAIRRMNGVILVGEAMKKELPGRISHRHISVIPNGLDISELKESSLAPLDEPLSSFFETHQPVVLGVGRLSREKGFENLILAFSDLRGKFPNSGLVIVGEGKLRQQFEMLVDELDVKDHVRMPGYCSKVPVLLKLSQVLVMPSLTEGLPITLLEALSLKTPVVASSVGEIPRVLSDGEDGELLSDVQPASISKAIEKSLSDEMLSSQRAESSYRQVCENYSAAAMAEQYLEFYNRVIEAP